MDFLDFVNYFPLCYLVLHRIKKKKKDTKMRAPAGAVIQFVNNGH